MIKFSNASCQTDPVKKELAGAKASTDKEIQDDEQGKKKNERKRKSFQPRIEVLRFVEDEGDSEELGDGKPQEQDGIKVECQMEMDPKTIVFELHTADIVPEEMANCFISEDLLAEKHRQIFVDQLVDIFRQLTEDPTTLPQVTFPPNKTQSYGSPPHKEEDDKEQQKSEKDEEMNNVPAPTPLRSSEAVSSSLRNGEVTLPPKRDRSPDFSPKNKGEGEEQQENKKDKTSIVSAPPSETVSSKPVMGPLKIEVPCAALPSENKHKKRRETFEDICVALFLICYLLVMYGVLWENEMDDNFVSILKCGMSTTSLVVLMIIVDKLSLYCEWFPDVRQIIMTLLWTTCFVGMIIGLFFLNKINRDQWDKGAHLFVAAVLIPVIFGMIPVVNSGKYQKSLPKITN